MPKQILIVDDDPHIREVLQFALNKAGYTTATALHGRDALEKLSKQAFDALVLDITMPEMDGLELCKELRKTSELPILFLSSRDEEIDRIIGFEVGGDDYITKPFSPRELVARIKAVLKRSHGTATPVSNAPLQKGALKLDHDRYTAYWHGKETLPLTATEFALLAALLKHPSKVFQRDELMDGAYGDITVSDRTIDSHIRRIRQKFAASGAEEVIETMHGIGYRLGPCE
ncbi:response regulator [bacterium]|nr:response regulator [bacterium]